MNKYLSKNPAKAVAVKESDLCACLWSDGEEGQWCRALILSVHDSMANVLFPDYGNQERVAVSELCTLPSQFYQLPFQAIHCSLHGVLREEKMTGPEVDDFFADLAADKICALQVVDCSGARASVEILDTELDDDETINSKLITNFHPIASLSPQLPEPGEPMVAVKLADVDEHGQLSIQVVGPGLTKLEELANQIEERYSNVSRVWEIKVVVGGVYCSEYRLDHSWYRVKVLKQLPQQKVLVEYVDYGNEEEVDNTCLRPKLDTALFSLPPQIVKCTMAGIPKGPWTSDAIDFLAPYIQVDELNLEVVDYCVKVGGGTSLTFPVIKLHVKNSEQEMVCINDDMLSRPGLFGSSGRESLPSHQQTSTVRASSSVSSAEQLTDRRHGVAAAHPRSHSVSSVPVFGNVSTETVSDAVFVGTQSQAPSITETFSNGTSTHHPQNNPDSKKTTESKTGGKPCTGVQMYTLQVKDDSFESSSISTLNETSGSSNTESDRSEQGSPQFQQPVTVPVGRGGGGKMELVHSPKECIRDGVPYVASPEEADSAAVKSGHLVPSPSSSAPLITSSPPFSPSVIPTTPPMSPPPISLAPSADDNSGRTEHGDGGVVVINHWAELPRGRPVEVEITWSCSPTNFTLLLLSNKPELDSVTGRLQKLVLLEPHPPQGSLSPGYVCAARYSLDSMWYRASSDKPSKHRLRWSL
ncbi:Tudor domain-containing protein 7 [Geodia barretti]|uniref:Tudor domain-containing protein 7 n=1 Tax=Geodia barretti TaxID=519541 RepID=A0AA35R390_GEOBA|nr:Tudor domain-containing protein 7 [Geodia barretti]